MYSVRSQAMKDAWFTTWLGSRPRCWVVALDKMLRRRPWGAALAGRAKGGRELDAIAHRFMQYTACNSVAHFTQSDWTIASYPWPTELYPWPLLVWPPSQAPPLRLRQAPQASSQAEGEGTLSITILIIIIIIIIMFIINHINTSMIVINIIIIIISSSSSSSDYY